MVLLRFVIISYVFVAGNTLECYQCFEEGNESCDGQTVECPTSLPGYCGNLVATYDGRRYFHQGCLRVNNCQTAAEDFRNYLKLSASDLFIVDCSSCSTDYCNSSKALDSFSSTGILCSFVTIYFLIV